MDIEIIQVGEIKIAAIKAENVLIKDSQDALDLMADCSYNGSRKIILYESNIIQEFFDLKTGIAGEILQKFSTYNVQLAIIGNYSKFKSKSLKDFIFESNKIGRINFVNSLHEAKECLMK
jgi:hypothetical protein